MRGIVAPAEVPGDVPRPVGHVRVHGRGGRVAKVEDAILLLLLPAETATETPPIRRGSEEGGDDAADPGLWVSAGDVQQRGRGKSGAGT